MSAPIILPIVLSDLVLIGISADIVSQIKREDKNPKSPTSGWKGDESKKRLLEVKMLGSYVDVKDCKKLGEMSWTILSFALILFILKVCFVKLHGKSSWKIGLKDRVGDFRFKLLYLLNLPAIIMVISLINSDDHSCQNSSWVSIILGVLCLNFSQMLILVAISNRIRHFEKK